MSISTIHAFRFSSTTTVTSTTTTSQLKHAIGLLNLPQACTIQLRVQGFASSGSPSLLHTSRCESLSVSSRLHQQSDTLYTTWLTLLSHGSLTSLSPHSIPPFRSEANVASTELNSTLHCFMLPKEKMDIPRGPTIALPIPNTATRIHQRQRHLSRSSSLSPSDSGRPSTSMAIPGARIDDIPPALPPPRYNNDLEHGLDLAWQWQNEHLLTGKSKLAPIKPGSSLLGTLSRPQLARDDEKEEDTDVDLTTFRAASSPSRSHLVTATSIPSLMRSPPSSSGINQR